MSGKKPAIIVIFLVGGALFVLFQLLVMLFFSGRSLEMFTRDISAWDPLIVVFVSTVAVITVIALVPLVLWVVRSD